MEFPVKHMFGGSTQTCNTGLIRIEKYSLCFPFARTHENRITRNLKETIQNRKVFAPKNENRKKKS